MLKISTKYVNMVTRLVYKKLKEAKLTKGTRSYKASPEKHKDDQGGVRNPYRCMNVMKQDAMDDKIIERCKTCEK